MRKIRILVCIFVLAVLLSSCETVPLDSILQNIEKPTVVSVKSRVTGTDILGIKLAFDVKVKNPYSFAIKKAKCEYKIEIEGSDFLDTEDDADVNIPAKKTGTVTLPARLNYLDMFRAYRHLKGKSEVDYLMRGNLIIMGIKVPIREKGTIPLS